MKLEIQQFLNEDISLVMAITGGGTQAIGELMKYGRASNSILEVSVPYSAESSSKYAGKTPEHFCSREHALNLAVSSYNRAKEQTPQKFCIGLGSTARLHVENERAGRPNEVWLAIHTDEETWVCHMDVGNIVGIQISNRVLQERKVADLIISKLLEIRNIDVPFMFKCPNVTMMVQRKLELFKKLYEIEPACYMNLKGNKSDLENKIVFPGSFNPIHEQHKKMAEVAHRITGKKVVFELCIKNTDKLSLDYMRLTERYENVCKLYDEPYFGGVVVTNTPLFLDKIKIIGNNHFIIYI